MALTINLTLLKRRKREDGTIPIYIRFTENRKSRYRSTGKAIKQKYWQYKKDNENPIHSDYRHSKKLNLYLRRLLREIKSVRDDLELDGNLSMDTLLDEIDEEKDPRSIIHQAKSYRKKLQKDDRYWERRHFKVVIGNIESFIDDRNKSDQLSLLDADWIEDFQDYLLNTVGNGNNTVRKKLQRLKGMTDWLLKQDELENDPFTRVERVESKRTNGKVKLSFDQIKAIKNVNLARDTRLWHVRNYFMYSFYNAGIRFGDLCCLKWKNLIDGRLVYEMNKTEQQKSINQLKPMYRLLFNYVNPGKYLKFSKFEAKGFNYLSRSYEPLNAIAPFVVQHYARDHLQEYIFPILDEYYDDPFELRKKISSKNVQVNNRLKTIAGKAGIQSNISFHVSRHSFAHYALKKGMDLYAISKALGHSDLKVTEEYLKTFDEELLDKSMNKLFN